MFFSFLEIREDGKAQDIEPGAAKNCTLAARPF
jgi:hypothetical protein